jgi:competence protein ComEC
MTDVALDASQDGAGRVPSAIERSRLVQYLSHNLMVESDRWMLWLPVFFGAGIASYFQLTSEPPALAGPLIFGVLLAAALICRQRQIWFWLFLPLAFVAAGFSMAEFRSYAVAGPMIDRTIGPATVSGRVIEVDLTKTGRRLAIDHAWITGLAHDRTPDALRLNAAGTLAASVKVGDWVRVRAIVSPIPPPAIPGGFDFQRFLYFDGFTGGFGGIGKILAAPVPMTPPRHIGDDWMIRLARARAQLTARVMAALPSDSGAVSAALIAGDQTSISDPVMHDMRDSGLAHILSISGLHIGLVAALLLHLIRGGLALIPPLALRYPIKKIAASGALVAVIAYSLLAGLSNVPVVRSLLMCGFVLLAVLIDRKPLSLQVVAWTALASMALTPEGMLGPSFQMSFGAVIALIAAGEMAAPSFAAWRKDAGILRRMMLVLMAMVFTSLVATLATSPSSVFIFNRIAVYGVLANMIAIPLSSLIIMPAGILAIVLMPFGLERFGLIPMGWGVDLLDKTAAITARLPGAVLRVPEMPVSALVAISLGGLWICIWRGRWRWWGIAGIVLGISLTVLARPPDMLVSASGRLVGINSAEHGLLVSRPGRMTMEQDSWISRLATERGLDFAAAADTYDDTGLNCSRDDCIYTAGATSIGWLRHPAALLDLCRRVRVLVSAVPVDRGKCQEPELVLDRASLARSGAVALWFDGDGIRAVTDRDRRGLRRWSPYYATGSSNGASDRQAVPAP